MVIRENAERDRAQQAARPFATQGGSKTTKHVDGLLDAFVTDEKTPRPRLVHRLGQGYLGRAADPRARRAARPVSPSGSPAAARAKVYWALVVGNPDLAEGVIDAPLAKQPGTGGEKMHIDEEKRRSGQRPVTAWSTIARQGARHW